MSRTVDTKVVEMEFDNAQFEKNVSQSMSTLDKLKEKLNSLSDSGKGLEQVSKAAKSFTLDDIGNSIDKLNSKFSVMGVAGMTAISEITKSALQLGSTLVHKVFDPINQGGQARAQKIEDAKFSLEGLGVTWSSIEKDINHGVADTAYGLDAAAKAAASLVASGVQFGEAFGPTGNSPMAKALRGISGVAAQTNSSYEEIAQIYTKVAGNGRLMGMELTQLSAKGMNAAAVLGKQLNKSEAEIRDMVSKGKIDFQTFSKAMDEAFGEHAKDANRTLNGVLANIKSALSKIGALFWEPIIRTDGAVVKFLDTVRALLNNIKKELIPLSETWDKFIQNTFGKLKAYMESLSAEDITAAITNFGEAATNVLKSLITILYPIKQAFTEVFEGTALGNIKSFTEALKTFTEYLVMDGKKMGYIKSAFKGVFDVIKLVADGVTALLRTILPFVTESDGLLEIVLKTAGIAGNILSFIVKLIRESGVLQKALQGLTITVKLLAAAVIGLIAGIVSIIDLIASGRIFSQLAEKASQFFEVLKGNSNAFNNLKEGLAGFVDKIKQALQNGGALGNLVLTVGQKIVSVIKTIGSAFTSVFSKLSFQGIGEAFSSLGTKFSELKEKIRSTITDGDISIWDRFVGILNILAGALADVIGVITGFIGALDLSKIAAIGFTILVTTIAININKLIKSFTGVGKAAKTFMGVLTNFFAGPKKWKPSLLEDIAIAVLAVAGALKIMSTIPADRLTDVAVALGILMAALSGFAVVLSFVSKVVNKENMAAVGLSIAALGAGVALIALALTKLENVKLDKSLLAKVLLVGGIATALSVAVAIMSKLAPKISLGALSILAFAFAVKKIIEALSELTLIKISVLKDNLLELMAFVGVIALVGSGLGKIGLTTALGVLAFVWAWKMVGEEIKETVKSIDLSGIKASVEQMSDNAVGIGVALGVLVGAIIGVDILLAKLGGGLKKLGIGIIFLVGAVGLMALVAKKVGEMADDMDAMKKGGKVIAQISIIIMAFEALAARTKESKMIQFGAAMIALTAAMGIMSGLAYMLGKISTKELWKGVGALGAIAAMIAVIEGVSGLTKDSKIGALLMIFGGLSALFAEMVILSMIPDMTPVMKAAGSMAAVMLSVAVIFKALNGFKPDLKAIAGMVAAIGILATVGYTLYELSGADWSNAIPMMASISGCLFALVGVMQLITNTDGRTFGKNKMKAVLVAVAALATVGLALKVVSEQPWDSILSSMGAIVGCLVTLLGVVKVMSGLKVKDKSTAVSLVIMSLSLLPIAAALKKVADYDWNAILPGLVGLNATLAVLGGVLALLGFIAGKGTSGALSMAAAAGSLLIASIGIMAIAKGLSFLQSNVDPGQLIASTEAIGGLMIIFGIMAAVCAASGETIALALVAIGAGFLLFGAGVLAAGAGIMLLANVLPILEAADWTTVTEGITGLGDSLAVLALLSLGILGSSVTIGLLALALTGLAGALILLQNGGETLAGISNGLMLLEVACDGLLGIDIQLALLAAAFAVLAIATTAMTTASLGMPIIADNLAILGTGIEALATSVEAAVDRIVSALSKLGVSLSSDMTKAANDAVGAFTGTLSANRTKLGTAGKMMAYNFLNPFRQVTGWHSWWDTMIDAAKDCVGAFVGTLKPQMGQVKAAGADMGISFGNGLEPVLDGVIGYAKEKLGGLLDVFNQFENMDINSIMDGFLGDITNMDEILPDVNGMMDGLATGIGDVGKAAGKAKDPIQSLTDTIANQMDIFSEWSAGEEISAEKMLDNMRSQVVGVTQWAENMQVLAARGIDQGLLQKLADLGPQGSAKVAAFVSMTDQQLQEANQLFATSLVLPGWAAQKVTGSFTQVSKDASTGYANGFDVHAGDAKAAEMTQNSVDTAKDVLKEKSPSRVMMEIGEYASEGLAKGIENLGQKPVNRMTILAKEVVEAAKSGLKASIFFGIGKNVGEGLAAGIEEGAHPVKSAMSKAVNACIDAAKGKQGFDEHSPSKVMYGIGEYATEGLANGLSAGTKYISIATNELTGDTISQFQSLIDRIANYIDSDMNLSPVITPILDMDGISEEVDRFNSLFGNSYSVSSAYDSSRNANMQQELDRRNAIYQLGARMLDATMQSAANGNNGAVTVNISLEGDASDIFRVVRNENSRYIKATGTSPLMATF